MRIQTLLVPAASLLLFACGTTTTEKASSGGSAPASEATKPAETKVAKQPWGSFKVGSYVVMQNTTEAAGRKMVMQIKTTLNALTADKATVEMETTVMGQTTKSTVDFPLVASTATPAPTGTASTPQAEVKTSEETITVAGKSLKCKVTTASSEANGMKSESKTWMSEEVPGFVVKSVVKTTGAASSETTSEMTDFKAS